MKFITITLLFFAVQLSAQNDTIIQDDQEFEIIEDMSEPIDINSDDDNQIKEMPEFPGGQLGLRRFIAEHVVYPEGAREKGIQGVVYLKFEVKKDGFVGKVEIQKGVHALIDNESIRVIKRLPKFNPGKLNGKPVNVWYSIPITFKLN